MTRHVLAVLLSALTLSAACAEVHDAVSDDGDATLADRHRDATPPSAPDDAASIISALDAAPRPSTSEDPDAGLRAALDAGLLVDVDAAASTVDSSTLDGGLFDAAAPAPGVVCAIKAHTDATGANYGGSYGCAIWIADRDEKLVRAIFRGSRINRYTPGPYLQAIAGVQRVDIVASATVRRPTDHTHTWPLLDNYGAVVPTGKYALKVATLSAWDSGVDPFRTDVVTVPFDTAQLPASAAGEPAPTIQSASIDCRVGEAE